MTDRLTKFNEETGKYEYRERAKTQEEFNAQRKAVIQRLGEFEDKASDVAEEIFEEIDEFICRYLNDGYYSSGDLIYDLVELEKKYTVTDTNVGCKESEKENG
jgi:hypothetical protein